MAEALRVGGGLRNVSRGLPVVWPIVQRVARCMGHGAVCGLLLLGVLAGPASALDDMANLKGMGVVASGQVKRLDCPIGGRFDCNSWPTNFLKFEYDGVCFAAEPGVCGAYCRGILATDKTKAVYFFEATPGGDLVQRRARGYECPPGF